jgi:hypothetical protein
VREGDHWGDPGVDGEDNTCYIRIMADFQVVGCGRMNWIELAQNRDRWQAV